MSQIIIDIGDAPDDGLGTPLRQAFSDINTMFTEVYGAGPVGSNIAIANNTITTSRLNGNIILAPSGIGVTQLNSSAIPRVNDVYDLGSPTLRWNTLYLGTGGFESVGNITGNYFIGNGSLLTGVVSEPGPIISNGTSNIRIATADGPIQFTVNGNSNVLVVTDTNSTFARPIIGTSAQFSGNVSASYFNGNVNGNISGNFVAPGTNTQVLFNDQGTVSATGGFVFDKTSNTVTIGGPVFASNVVGAVGSISTLTVNTLANINQANITTTVSAAGNITGGNLSTAGNVTSSNVNAVNIYTSTLSTTGSAVIGGNLTVTGNTTFINVQNLNVEDPIVGIGRGANNTPLVANDGKDRGEQLWYYSGNEKSAFIGYDNSAGNLILATDVSISGEIVSVNNYGNITVGNIQSQYIVATANVTGGNFVTSGSITAVGNINTSANINASHVEANISGTSLSMSGNIYGNTLFANTAITAFGNVVGQKFIGNLDAAGNITEVQWFGLGDVISANDQFRYNYTNFILYVGNGNNGNIVSDNFYSSNKISTGGFVTAVGNVTSGNLITGGLITATGNINSSANIQGANLITGGLITSTGNITSSANIQSANLITSGNLVYTGGQRIAVVGSDLSLENSTGGGVNLLSNAWAQLQYTSDFANANPYNAENTNWLFVDSGGATIQANSTGGNHTWQFTTDGVLTASGNITASANIQGANLITNGVVSASANIIGGNLTTTGIANVGTLAVTGSGTVSGSFTATGNVTGGNISTAGIVTAAGNITSGANINGNFVSPGANREVLFNDNGLVKSNALLTFDKAGPTLALNNTAGTVITGYLSSLGGSDLNLTPATNNLVIWGSANPRFSNTYTLGTSTFQWLNVWAGNANIGSLSVTGTSTLVGNVTVTANLAGGNISTSGLVTATGNITSSANVAGANLVTGGLITATGNITSAANVQGSNVIAVQTVYGANIAATEFSYANNFVATSNVLANNVNSNGIVSAGGNIVTTANVSGGNIITTGLVTATGNIRSNNLTTVNNVEILGNKITTGTTTGLLFEPGNVSLISGNLIVNGGYIYSQNGDTAIVLLQNGEIGSVGIANNLQVGQDGVGNLHVAGYANVTTDISVGGNASVTGNAIVTANISGGNISSSGQISATANVTGGNLVSGGIVTAVGNIVTSANVNAGNVNTGVLASTAGISITTGSNGNINLQPNGTGNIVLSNTYINSVAYPAQDQDAASKLYVDTMVSTQIAYHEPVFAATISNLAVATGGTITYNQPNGAGNGIGATITTTGSFDLIDTANIQTVGTRILVKDEGNAVLNGVYTWSNATVIVRSTDADEYGTNNSEQISVNDYFFVQSGNVNAGTSYVVSAPAGTITFGTSNITFAQFSASQTYTAGNGININGSQISAKVDNNTTAFDSGGNIIVKASANLTTPNIGAATGTSLSLTGNLNANNVVSTNFVSATTIDATANITGGNLISNGLASITGNLSSGNSYILGFANVQGNGHVFGNMHIGQDLSFVASNANLQYAGTANAYMQFLLQNKDNGSAASSDFVATADNGTDADTYIDVGINSSGYSEAAYAMMGPNDGYVYVYGNTTTNGGKLFLATGTAQDIVFATGGFANSNITGRFQHGNGFLVLGNIYGANVQANYFIGDGSQLTNISVGAGTQIVSGNSDVSVDTPNGNVTVTVSGQSNIVVVSTAGVFVNGLLSATGNLTGNYVYANVVTASGNVIGNYILGNGACLTGVITSVANINNGTSNIRIDSAGGNILANVGGTANVWQLTPLGQYVTGNIEASANITANNFIGNANASSLNSGTVPSARLSGTYNINISGLAATANTVTDAAQPNITSVGTLISLSVTGNVTAGNLVSNASLDVIGNAAAGNISTVGLVTATGNITSTANVVGGNLFTAGIVTATGNVVGGNITTAGIVTATGNIISTANVTGGNITTAGIVTATGNIIGGNLTTAGQVTATGNITSTANVSGGNLVTAGLITATGNVIGGNIETGGLVTATANIIGGNLTTAGLVTATGNVIGGNVSTAGLITATGNINSTANVNGGNLVTGGLLTATGNVTGGNLVTSGIIRLNNTAGSQGEFQIGDGTATSFVVGVGSGLSTWAGAGSLNLITSTSPGANIGVFVAQSETARFTNTGVVITGIASATGNITGGNISTAGLITATGNITSTANVQGNFILGNGYFLTGIITSVANINNGSSNIRIETSGGNILANVGGVANVFALTPAGANVSGNLDVTGNISASYYTGNGYYLTGIITSVANINNGTSNIRIDTAGGNAYANIGGTANVLTIASTGLYVNGEASASGNITGGNVVTGGLVSATGNITSTSNIAGGNLSLTGSVLVGGNLTVNGNVSYVNVDNLNVEDPIIGLGRGPNNTPLVSDDGKDRGEQLWYYSGSEKSAFIGYDNSAGKILAATDVTITNEIVAVNAYGNLVIGGLEATTVSTTGNITGGNINTSGIITASGNITSTANIIGGNINTLGLISASGNINGNFFNGNGSALTGIAVSKIANGTSNVEIASSNGNIGIAVAGKPVGVVTESTIISQFSNWANTAGTGNITYTAYTNSMLIGPFTVLDGYVVTVPDDAVLEIY